MTIDKTNPSDQFLKAISTDSVAAMKAQQCAEILNGCTVEIVEAVIKKLSDALNESKPKKPSMQDVLDSMPTIRGQDLPWKPPWKVTF